MSSAPQLFVAPEFLSEHEVGSFVSFFKSDCPWVQPDGADHYERSHWSQDTTVLNEKPEWKYLADMFEEISDRARTQIEAYFGETLVQPKQFAMRKWIVGDEQAPHSDVGHSSGILIFSPTQGEHGPLSIHQYDIASVLYFNNDFTGGQTYFEYQGIEIRPRPGMLIAFPTSHQYLHGVTPVTSGNRYVMTAFYPYARTIIHNLLPNLPGDWYKKFSNYREIMGMIPAEQLGNIPEHLRPPDWDNFVREVIRLVPKEQLQKIPEHMRPPDWETLITT